MRNETSIGIKQVLLYYFYLSREKKLYFNTLRQFIIHFYKRISDKNKCKIKVGVLNEELVYSIKCYIGDIFKVEPFPPFSLDDIVIYFISKEDIELLISKNKINEEEIVNAMKDFFNKIKI